MENLSTRLKRRGHEADNSPPTSALVENEWSHTSTPAYVFMACLGTNVPLSRRKFVLKYSWLVLKRYSDNRFAKVRKTTIKERVAGSPVKISRGYFLKPSPEGCCDNQLFRNGVQPTTERLLISLQYFWQLTVASVLSVDSTDSVTHCHAPIFLD